MSRSADPRPVLALFDFDGTITTRETLPDFLRLATPPRRLFWGKVLFALPMLAYRCGLLPVRILRSWLIRYAFAGLTRAEIESAGHRFARDILPGLVRPAVQASIDAHRAAGDTVVVVSGGFDVYLAPWCAAQGIDLLCSTLESHDDRLSGRYAGAQCVAEEKARRVRARYDVDAYREIHAHGDTPEDHALLALAHRASYRGAPWPMGPDDARPGVLARHDADCRSPPPDARGDGCDPGPATGVKKPPAPKRGERQMDRRWRERERECVGSAEVRDVAGHMSSPVTCQGYRGPIRSLSR